MVDPRRCSTHIPVKKKMSDYVSIALPFIAKHEELRLNVYKDAAGFDTIGYGHLLLPKEKFTTITKAKAEEILAKDLSIADQVIDRYTKVPLNNNQRAALISLIFNIGGGNFLKSTLLKKLNEGDYEEAGNRILRFVFSAGKKLPGLVKRRAEERDLFFTA